MFNKYVSPDSQLSYDFADMIIDITWDGSYDDYDMMGFLFGYGQ